MTQQSGSSRFVDTLYHYQPYQSDRLTAALFNRKVRFSNPVNFNDPWDCRPFFHMPSESDQSLCDEYINWYISTVRSRTSAARKNEIDAVELKMRTDRAYFEHTFMQFGPKFFPAFSSLFRVYCLTTKPDSPLMWSHYASNHKGICLEFSCRNRVFCCASPVKYVKNYPAFHLSDMSDDTSIEPLITKADYWSYENEYRVVAQDRVPMSLMEDAIRTRRDFLMLPWTTLQGSALRAVIVGCMMPSKDMEEITKIMRNIFPRRVALKRAIISPHSYDVSIEPIEVPDPS